MHNLTKIRLFRIVLYLTYPFSLLISLPLALAKKKSSSQLFFFLDRYSVGGAQRVYLDILSSVEDILKHVYFTRKSYGDAYKKEFYSFRNSKTYDIHFFCDYLLVRPFSVHFFAFYLNKHEAPVIVGSNSTFFYDMLPFLKQKAKTVEVFHNFSYGKRGMEFFGLANYRFLDHRIVVDSYTLSNIKSQYIQYGVESYFNRISMIEPGVEIPKDISKDYSLPLKVLYAGRGGPQKRVPLISRIAERLIKKKAPVKFYFAGPVASELSEEVRNSSTVYGEISNRKEMSSLYRECHVVILTSKFEGFPMVIKEGMAHACVPVVTALEGNKMHLSHRSNSLLIEAIEEEDNVVTQGERHLEDLFSHPELLQNLSQRAYQYARKNFQKRDFLDKYRMVLTLEKK